MSDAISRLTSKSQTTIPKAVRDALAVGPGDSLAYEIKDDAVLIRKASPLDREYLRNLESTLTEWSLAEDAEAYDDL